MLLTLAIVATLQGVSAGNIHAFSMPNRGTTTWQQAEDACKANNLRLCMREEICPNGKWAEPYGGMPSGPTVVPTAEQFNSWTDIYGNGDTSALCVTQQEKWGDLPSIFLDESFESGNRDHDRLYCCEGALGGCILVDRWGLTDGGLTKDSAVGDQSDAGKMVMMGIFDTLSGAYEYAIGNGIPVFTWHPPGTKLTNYEGAAWGATDNNPVTSPNQNAHDMATAAGMNHKWPNQGKMSAFTVIVTDTTDFPNHAWLRSEDACQVDRIDFNNLPQPGGALTPCSVGTLRPALDQNNNSNFLERFYTQAECESIDGIHVANGECLKKPLNTGSYTRECRLEIPADGSPLEVTDANGITTRYSSYSSCA